MRAQSTPFPLPTIAFVASGRASVDFSSLPAQLGGRMAAVSHITFDVQVTPTTSAGSPTATELQKIVSNCVIKDGVRELWNGSFGNMRLSEALENGGLLSPDCDAAATTEAVNFQRVWSCAPGKFARPEDFLKMATDFRGGSIDFSFGALTDVTATTTALAATISPVVWLTPVDDFLFPSLVERREGVLTNGTPLTAEALYCALGITDAQVAAALTAGDLANVSVTTAAFQTKQTHVAILERAYHAQLRSAVLNPVKGEPRAATDDNVKVQNGTALAAAPALISPVIWTPEGCRISRLAYQASPSLTLNWSGSQGSAYYLATRLIPRDAQTGARYMQLGQAGLGVRIVGGEINTMSKRPYPPHGPRKAYLPVKGKVS